MAIRTEWTFNGLYFPFDIYSTKDMTRYNNARIRLSKANIADKFNDAEGYAIGCCRAIMIFFADMFGEECIRELFGSVTNRRICTDTLTSFVCFVNEQIAESERIKNQAIEKYAPKKGGRT